MLEIFIYPVSGLMRLWHFLLHSVFNVDDHLAWTISLFLLVLTVRSIIAPFMWMQLKSARNSILMRPALHRLNKEYENATERAEVEEYQAKTKQLRQEFNYSVAAGCVPALIQVPVFLGLYQVLLRMARPEEGLESTTHQPIGMLTSEHVAAFLQARVADVPLPAYNAMNEAQFARLHTDYATVHSFVTPLIIAACIFTFINMVISTMRSLYSMDHDQAMSVKMTRLMFWFIPIAPLSLLMIGFTGPIPVAIVMYWVANNAWTFIQNSLMYLILRAKYPFDAEHKAFQAERKTLRKQRRREYKLHKRQVRRKRLAGVVQPWRIPEYRAEIRALKDEYHAPALAEKERLKEVRKERSKAENEIRNEKIQAKVSDKVLAIANRRRAKQGLPMAASIDELREMKEREAAENAAQDTEEPKAEGPEAEGRED